MLLELPMILGDDAGLASRRREKHMFRRIRVVLVSAAGLACLANDGIAQTTVLLRTTYMPPLGCAATVCPTAVFAYDPDGRALRGTEAVAAGNGAYLTPDGALLIAFDEFNPRLLVLDRPSGVEFSIPLSPSAVGVVGNPVRPEVYLNDATGGLALAVTGVRRLSTPTCASPMAVAVSADGRRLAYRYLPGGGNPGYSAVLDTATAVLVSVVPSGWSPVLNADGSVLFQVEFSPGGSRLRRYLTDSGTLDAEAVIAPSVITPTIVFDSRSRRVFVPSPPVAAVFDETTLASQSLPGCASTVTAMVFGRDRPCGFLVGYNSYEPFVLDDGWFCEIDTTSLARTASYRYSKPRASAQSAAMAEVPRPPAALASQVAGTSAALTWQAGGPPAAITRNVLEVGSAPRLNDIIAGLDVGLQMSFSASGVPPGRYYVRVRAGNYTGLSAPSNEVVVQVP